MTVAVYGTGTDYTFSMCSGWCRKWDTWIDKSAPCLFTMWNPVYEKCGKVVGIMVQIMFLSDVGRCC